MRNRETGQSAVEMLTIYSWALLIIGFLVVLAFVIIFSQPQANYISSTCTIQPQLPCTDVALSNYNGNRPIGYRLEFQNSLAAPIVMSTNAFNVITTGNLGSSSIVMALGNCYPSTVLPGGTATCNVSISGSTQPSVGTRMTTYFSITYGLCANSAFSGCSTTKAYTSTGYSIQALSSAAPTLYAITTNSLLNTYSGGFWSGNSPTNAVIEIGGSPYVAGTTFYLTAGNYVISAQPISGYSFMSWVVNAPAITTNVLNYTVPQTNIYITSSANIVANYTDESCGVCTNINTGSGCHDYVCCPGACPEQISCGLSRNKCIGPT